MILRRVLLVLALLAAALLALLWLGSGWLGPLLLARYAQTGKVQVTAGRISGPLWSPTAHDLQVQIDGVQVKAAQAHIYLTQVNVFAKSARVNMALSDGQADIHFKQLFAGLKGKRNGGGGTGFALLPGQLDIHNMRLNLDGQGANIPNAHLKVVSSQPGQLGLAGASDYGPLSATVRYGEVGGKVQATIDALSDARIINEYWHGGILGGQVAAHYRVGSGPIAGDLKVTDGVVAVPQAKFVRIERISGAGTQRGNLITGRLRGVGLGSPIIANVKVDTKAKNWDVQAQGTPTFAGLGKALGVPGSGQAKLSIHAGGWTTVNVRAVLASPKGSFASIPFTKLGAVYGWQSSSHNRHTTITRNVANFQADTHLLGEAQKLWGEWHLSKAGKLHWTGKLAQQPLNVLDVIDRRNQMSLRGLGLGGPVQGSFNPKRKRLDAQLSPRLYGLSAQLGVSGVVSDLGLQVAHLRGAGLDLSGTGRLNKAGLMLGLQQPGGGVARVQTSRQWRGTWALSGLKVPQGSGAASGTVQAVLNGQGTIDLTRRLSGQLSLGATLPAGLSVQQMGAQQAGQPARAGLLLSGPLSLDWKSRVGQWQAGQQRLWWQGQKLGAQLRGLGVRGLNVGPLSGQTLNLGGLATYRLDTRAVGGQLVAQAPGVQLRLDGLGRAARVTGTVQGLDVTATTRLDSGNSDRLNNFDTAFSVGKAGQAGGLSGNVQLVQAGQRRAIQVQVTSGTAPGERQRARALIDGNNWEAAGKVNLAALYPLLPASTQKTLAGLSGVALLNLHAQGGTVALQGVQVRTQGRQVALQGVLTRQAGQTGQGAALGTWHADLQASTQQASTQQAGTQQVSERVAAHLRGQVYPQLDLSGPVEVSALPGATGLTAGLGTQRVQARLYGPYRALRLQASGQLTALNLGGVGVGAQPLSVAGTLTPRLNLAGQWGQLQASYSAAQGTAQPTITVRGPQALTVAGRRVQVGVAATWRPDWSGSLTAVGRSGEYQVRAAGPWRKLNVAFLGAGLQAQGTLNAQRQSYAATVSGRLAGSLSGLTVAGKVSGVGARPSGTLSLKDAQGGTLQARMVSPTQFSLSSKGLRVAGQTLRGDLTTQAGGLLSGVASLGPLELRVRQGQFTARGVYQRHNITASGFWRLPQQFTGLKVAVDGPYLRATLAGRSEQLRGVVQLRPQRVQQGQATISLPAQSLPLTASLTRREVTVGGLRYAGGWSGAAPLRYQVAVGALPQAGRVTLVGQGAALQAQLTGVVAGQAQVLPALHGSARLGLSSLGPLLPAQVRGPLALGTAQSIATQSTVQVRFDRQGASFATQHLSWGARPAALTGQINWPSAAAPLRLSALLTQGRTRLPVQLRGRALRLVGGRVTGQSLEPLLASFNTFKLAGPLRGDVAVEALLPDLSLSGAQAKLGLNLSAGTQAAAGTLNLQGGQWTGNLGSTLGGADISVRGALYPQAQATVRYTQGTTALTGTLSGDARQAGAGQYLALVAGRYQGKAVQGKASLSPQRLEAQISGLGAQVRLSAQSGARAQSGDRAQSGAPVGTLAPLNRWRVQGSLEVPQTQALLGRVGTLSAQVAGTAQDLQGQLVGSLELSAPTSKNQSPERATFTVPLRYKAGVLRAVQGRAAAPLAGTQVKVSGASGALWPRLDMQAQATLGTLLPGQYRLQLAGTPSRPALSLSGVLSEDLRGFGVRGTRLQAHLSGKDLRLNLSGAALSGFVQGRTDQPGYVQRADLQLNTTYRAAGTALALRGPLGWSAGSAATGSAATGFATGGWTGRLNVGGQYQARPFEGQLEGHSDLSVQARYGAGQTQASLSAALPASILQRPGGRVQLQAWDIGALWQRPGELSVSGVAALGGPSWSAWRSQLEGRLIDRAGDLSGPLSAQYAAGSGQAQRAQLQFTGQKMQLAALLTGTQAQLDLHSRGVELARLLPAAWKVGRLNVVGHLAAKGSVGGGLEDLQASSLYLSGQQEQLGDFHVGGEAQYQPGVYQAGQARANLSGALLGGTFTASGSLPAGLDVRLSHLDLSRLNSGRLGATQRASTTTSSTPTDLQASLHLRGDWRNPALSGTAQLARADSLTNVVAYGRLKEPRLHARTQLKDKASGTLYADLWGLDMAHWAAQVHLYGNAQLAQNRLKVDMQGVWPRLSGQATAQIAGLNTPVVLTGQGNGRYRAQAAGGSQLDLGLSTESGFLPQLTGQGVLDVPALLGAQGEGTVRVSVSGPVNNLQVLGQGMLRGVSRNGITLDDAALTLSGTPSDFTVQAQQSGQTVATFDGRAVSLTGAGFQALGSDITLSGGGTLGGSQGFRGQLGASGSVQGALKVSYLPGAAAQNAAGQLSVTGQLGAAGFNSLVNVQATNQSGWTGRVNVTGGPVVGGIGPVLTQPLALRVGGDWQRPWVRGTLGLLGSRGRLEASESGAALTFSDGPRAQASGSLNLTRQAGAYRWNGAAHFERAQGKVDVQLRGEAARPQLSLKAQRGNWSAQGQLASVGALSTATLNFGDGQQTGRLDWQRSAQGQSLEIRSAALNLARLNITGVAGRVQPYAHLQGVAGLSGNAGLYLAQVKTGLQVPYLGFPLDGSGKVNFISSATVSAASAAPQWQLDADLHLSSGPLTVQLLETPSATGGRAVRTGHLKANLQQQKSPQQRGGALVADVGLGRAQLSGSVAARGLNVQPEGGLLGGKQATVDGQLVLRGQEFSLNAQATSEMGSAALSGAGGMANAAPAARKLLGIMPVEGGYQLQAQLNELDVSKFSKSMDMSGKVSAQLTLAEGGGTFAVRAPALKLGESTLNTRVDGTRSGSDWRLRGVLGDTTFFGAVTDGQLHARAQMAAFPLGSLVEAASGKRVGQATITGITRLDAPLADPLAGSATVVAERVKVVADDQTLLGQGSLHFSARELSDIQLKMQGAGSWDVHGQYTRQKVDLTADFVNTTFTPLLALVPALGAQATLKGSLNFKVGGAYGNPAASLRSQSLTGSYAGSRFGISALQGNLDTAGKFQAGLQVDAAGTVGGKGSLQASGQVQGGKVQGGLVRYAGTLSAETLGELGQSDVRLTQSVADTSIWTVDAALRQGGTLQVAGQVAPTPELRLTARNYNLPIRAIYARESSVNADLKATSDADNVLVSGQVLVNRMLLGRLNAQAKTGNPLLDAAQPKEPAKAASTYNSPLPEALTTFASSAQATQKQVPPFLKRVIFQNIPIQASNNLRVEESLAQAELSADLKLSGTGDNPLLSGEVHSVRGSLTLRDNTFSVQKAVAQFDGSGLYPTFTMTAQGNVMDAQTRLGVQLQADGSFVLQPQGVGRTLALTTALTCTTCTSATPYTEAELYSLVALGTKDVNTVLDSQNLTALGTSAASTALNVFVLGELQRNIAHALGVDVFRINSNILDAQGNLDASFTVGTYLSKQFYVQYQVDLTGKGLFDATYTTDNGRFTFKASTAMTGFNLETIKPSFSVLYNLGTRHSLSLGVESGVKSKFSAGYVYRW